MALSRDTDIVKAVLRTPRTARMIFLASSVFELPYTNFTQVKTDLRRLTEDGVLGRVEVPGEKSGRNEFLYYVKSGAKRLLPELKVFKAGSAMFRLPGTSPHSLYTAEFLSHFEQSAGAHRERVEILETIRDGRFSAKVELTTAEENRVARLIPDLTVLAEIDGKLNLFFLELQNHVRSIEAVTADSISKTFREKLMKYKAFQREFRSHSFIHDAEAIYGCRIPGFRVLIVTTKSEMNRNRLLSCARAMGYGEMFHFATLDEVRQSNVLTDPMWSLTTFGENRKVALMDSSRHNCYHSKTSSDSAASA